MSVYKKLLDIQKTVTKMSKDERAGAGSYGYKFVSGVNLLNVIRPKMDELGLILKQEVVDIEVDRIDYTTKNGSKSECLYKGKLRFTWVDTETGETDVNEFFSAGMNDWEKGAGSMLTYAERYFLLKYFHIPTDEDDPDKMDRGITHDKPVKEDQESKLDQKFLKYWNSLSDDKRVKIGEKYPNKFGKPQLNPQYFKKSEKEEILKKVEEARKHKEKE